MTFLKSLEHQTSNSKSSSSKHRTLAFSQDYQLKANSQHKTEQIVSLTLSIKAGSCSITLRLRASGYHSQLCPSTPLCTLDKSFTSICLNIPNANLENSFMLPHGTYIIYTCIHGLYYSSQKHFSYIHLQKLLKFSEVSFAGFSIEYTSFNI